MSEPRQIQPAGNADDGIFVQLFRRSRSFVLLAAMLLQILLSTLGYPDSIVPLLLNFGIVIAAVVTVSDTRRHMTTGLGLGIPSLILLLVSQGTETPITDWIAYFMVVALYLYVIQRMLTKIFRADVVTVDTIGMALCTYVLLGQVWMLLYRVVVHYDPGAFSVPIAQSGSGVGLTLTYFSYVTLTTLGYGDISPVSPIARSLAILEALTGTLFLAVLISRLVGTYRSRMD